MMLHKNEKIFLICVLLISGYVLYSGWRVFWFQTDDAYISFRYVSNSMAGHGYVWNPPPFKPVEGYTNFLWIVLLDIVWRIAGIKPPDSANYLSLIFSYLTLMVGTAMVLKLVRYERLEKYRSILAVLMIIGVVSNRTFLAWTSSGLETAMYNFFLSFWVYCCLFIGPAGMIWGMVTSLSAACIYLTRPDGLLFAAATLVILCYALVKKRKNKFVFLGGWPLFLIVIHFLWRKIKYGEWFPNTYYAKVVGLWPESGLRYAFSFILEYSLWFWLVLVFSARIKYIYIFYRKRAGNKSKQRPRINGGEDISSNDLKWFRTYVCVIALFIHVLYYIIVVGGDHFEYRVFSHLILLIFVSFVFLVNYLEFKPVTAIVSLILFILLSSPIPWVHWFLTHNLESRRETHVMKISVTGHFPKFCHWYTGFFDDMQNWLISHHVCMRHQEHKIFHQHQLAKWPSREEGMMLDPGGYPVANLVLVGVPSWVMPGINIIDMLGLNDYVVARIPPNPGHFRVMGHDRSAPREYFRCFSPNVHHQPGEPVTIIKREIELTAENIKACEETWINKVRNKQFFQKQPKKTKKRPVEIQ